MPGSYEGNYPHRIVENIAVFGGSFVFGHVGQYVIDLIHNPQVTDIPRGVVISVGLVISGLSTAIVDRRAHRNH